MTTHRIVYGTDTESVEDATQCVLIDAPDHLTDSDDVIEWVRGDNAVFMQDIVGSQDTLEALTLILQGERLNADMIDRILTSLTDAWTNNAFDPWEYGASALTDVSDCIVRFQAEAWVNDNAIPVDPQGATTWNVSEDTKQYIIDAGSRGSDFDFVRKDRLAPSWVRGWSGPFTIFIESPQYQRPAKEKP